MTLPRQQVNGLGVYGFGIDGLEGAEKYLNPAEADWPRLRLVQVRPELEPEDAPAAGAVDHDEKGVRIALGGGQRIEIERETFIVRLVANETLTPDAIVHPYLGLPAAIASRWVGRLSMHGAAFTRNGRAWAVLGDREGGKSSTVAWLLCHGHQVLSDDVLAIEDRVLFTGPRCVDLRDEAALLLGGESLGLVGGRERWRLRSEPGPPSLPLGGIVHLEWADRLSIEEVPSDERLPGVVRHSVFPPDQAAALAYLDLVSLPTWRFRRPRDIADMDEAMTQLLAVLS